MSPIAQSRPRSHPRRRAETPGETTYVPDSALLTLKGPELIPSTRRPLFRYLRESDSDSDDSDEGKRVVRSAK
eukprot:8195660-Pyramimonas_sp.AAC.1